MKKMIKNLLSLGGVCRCQCVENMSVDCLQQLNQAYKSRERFYQLEYEEQLAMAEKIRFNPNLK